MLQKKNAIESLGMHSAFKPYVLFVQLNVGGILNPVFSMKSHSRRTIKQQSKIHRSLPSLINGKAVPGVDDMNYYG
jgi:hypothetical membrane protein